MGSWAGGSSAANRPSCRGGSNRSSLATPTRPSRLPTRRPSHSRRDPLQGQDAPPPNPPARRRLSQARTKGERGQTTEAAAMRHLDPDDLPDRDPTAPLDEPPSLKDLWHDEWEKIATELADIGIPELLAEDL